MQRNYNLQLLLRIASPCGYYRTMFRITRLFSWSSAAGAVLVGLVFVTGMLAGAALRAPVTVASPAPEPRAQEPGWQDLKVARGSLPAEVLRVNDGDTFEARVHVWPGMQVTTKVRLRGIDAAESNARCQE